jgi:hypothetical protein
VRSSLAVSLQTEKKQADAETLRMSRRYGVCHEGMHGHSIVFALKLTESKQARPAQKEHTTLRMSRRYGVCHGRMHGHSIVLALVPKETD